MTTKTSPLSASVQRANLQFFMATLFQLPASTFLQERLIADTRYSTCNLSGEEIIPVGAGILGGLHGETRSMVESESTAPGDTKAVHDTLRPLWPVASARTIGIGTVGALSRYLALDDDPLGKAFNGF